MKTYEYQAIDNGNVTETVSALDKEGQEGWEAIGLLNQSTILMKRECKQFKKPSVSKKSSKKKDE